jgi:hypothetical protein
MALDGNQAHARASSRITTRRPRENALARDHEVPPCSRPWDDASHDRDAETRQAVAWRRAPALPERVSNPGRAHLARAFNHCPTQPSLFLPFHRLDVPNITAPCTFPGGMKPQRLAAAWHGQCVRAGLKGDRGLSHENRNPQTYTNRTNFMSCLCPNRESKTGTFGK